MAAYYFLVASLPYLPHFEEAEWLPITRKQLESRLNLLEDTHRAQLARSEELLRWENHPAGRTTEEIRQQYSHTMDRISHPRLRGFVEFQMDLRTVLAALRLRATLVPPGEGEPWGVGRWVRRIQTRWDAPDFGLSAVFPWIEEARLLVERQDGLELERFSMNLVWHHLERISDSRPFGFEQVFAYFFRWDILSRWLNHDADAATRRFQDLIEEVTRDHEQLFHS
jgi:hypothetical protein